MKNKNKISEKWKNFFDTESIAATSKFEIEPVSPKEFFTHWLQPPLFPEQLRAVEALFTNDFKDWDNKHKELLLLWGEGAGKDFTIVRMLVYVAYWLLCLKDPQEYFSLASFSPIDIGNVSVNGDHAANVFFKQFTIALYHTKNPITGKNWFEERGMNLKEGKDIQRRVVNFPKQITAYSLDSMRYTGEGKNLLIAVFDEVGEFRFDKAKTLYKNLQNTAFSRFQDFYKIVMISYIRDEYDFMAVHYDETKDRTDIYRSNKAVWEVRPDRTKEDYLPQYNTDPEDAARRYENKLSTKRSGKFIKEFDKVLACIDYERPSPFTNDTIYTTNLNEELLQPWFKPNYTYDIYKLELEYDKTKDNKLKQVIEKELEKHANKQYYIHIDLAKGTENFGGICILHPYQKTLSQVGYYVDLMIQIRPDEDEHEINFENIRKFIFKLHNKGFSIAKVTLDGFSSIDFTQILNSRGIECDNKLSLDRSLAPYSTCKDLIYQGLVDMYFYQVLIRELKELLITDKKVDHPKESRERDKTEGIKSGSKDISDCLAGAIFSASSHPESEPVCVTPDDIDPDIDDIINKL